MPITLVTFLTFNNTRITYFYRTVWKEEQLRLRCIVGKIQLYFGQIFKCSIRNLRTVKKKIDNITMQEVICGPSKQKPSYILRFYGLDNKSRNMDISGRLVIFIMQGIESIKP